MLTLLKFQESILPILFWLPACLKLSIAEKIEFLKCCAKNYSFSSKIRLLMPNTLLIVFVIFQSFETISINGPNISP
jgi:hypothetical protein